jgi:tetratricopeptide (TPR) repeat protein
MGDTTGDARLHQQAREIFVEARRLDSTAQAPFVKQACGADEVLRREVESLLAYARTADGFLEQPPLSEAASGPSADVEEGITPGTRVGAYRVQRFIAAGAMGSVYEAAQDQPRRSVALKILRHGVASSRALRRFEFEVEVLGHLKHPGIAQIFEAGTFEHQGSRRPFFALELVEGRPLLDYAESARLDLREKIRLLVRVCDAVNHAHQRGVIHRDLKPANILVDAAGQPKVLDFGVARATDADLQLTTQTDLGQIVGTVPYMSPEQVQARAGNLDTRCDVYALGVITYELLAGRLPYDLAGGTLPQAIRTISEQEPVPLGSVHRACRGDLETIIAKSLEKDPQRRYPSVSDFAADLTRWLKNEPIQARAPSAMYQMRKLARRHPGLLGGLAAAAVVFIAGAVGVGAFAIRADRARRAAEIEGANAREAGNFIADILASADPETSKGQDLTVREILDQAAAKVERGFQAQPQVKAYLHGTLGDAYYGLGLYGRAEEHIDAAVSGYRESLGPDHEKTIRATGNRAAVDVAQGRLDAAESRLRETLEVARRVLGPDHDATLTLMMNLAEILMQSQRLDEAEALDRQAYDLALARYGPKNDATLQAMSNVATVCFYRGRLDEAVDVLRRSLSLHEEMHGADDPRTLTVLSNLASTLRKQGQLEEAMPLYVEALERKRRVLGNEHPSVLISLYNLAVFVDAQDKFTEAEVLFLELIDAAGRALPSNHWRVGLFRGGYGMNLVMQGRFGEAEPELLASLDVLRAALGEEHAQTRAAVKRLRSFYKKWEKPDKAAEYEALLAERPEP